MARPDKLYPIPNAYSKTLFSKVNAVLSTNCFFLLVIIILLFHKSHILRPSSVFVITFFNSFRVILEPLDIVSKFRI